jgi:agmatine deiminase
MGRRGFLDRGWAIIDGVLGADDSGRDDDGRRWVMPDEGQPHARTWMAFGATRRVWGRRLLPQVQRDLAAIADAIAAFEPVSMLVRAEEMAAARGLVGPGVELVEAVLDDIWIRDTGPVFVRGETGWGGVDFNFNGWGGKQSHRRDAEVAGQVGARAGVEALETDLVLEGGGVEVDGEGTAIITESCVLNRNRNPGWKRHEVEEELAYLLGIEKVIWLPGLAGYDITDWHTDFYARFAHPAWSSRAMTGTRPHPIIR